MREECLAIVRTGIIYLASSAHSLAFLMHYASCIDASGLLQPDISLMARLMINA